MLPGIRAWSPARRAAGGRGLRSPLPPTTPNPALGQPSLTGSMITQAMPFAPSLPRGSGRSDSRCPAPARDERPSGVGASAPAGRRSPPRPASLASTSRNRCSRFASGTPSPAMEPEKRLSVGDSVQWVRETVARRRKCSPLAGARAVTSPTSSASRGAEAIPAERERRSRRAYHPRSGKMRADLPPAASG